MVKSGTRAKNVLNKHFAKFMKTTKVQGMQVIVYDILPITPKTNKAELARKFAENFRFLKLDDHWRPVSLDKIRVSPKDSKKAITRILREFKDAKFFASIWVSYMGKSGDFFAIVKDRAKPGDVTRIIDPLSGSAMVLSETRKYRNSDHDSESFSNLAGGWCEFTADLEAICDGATKSSCRGNARYVKGGLSPFWQGKAEKGPTRCNNNCCEMDYAFGLAYGLSDVTITYSNGDFTITVGSLSSTYLDKEGTLVDCCPAAVPTGTSSTAEGRRETFGLNRGRIQIQGDDMNPQQSWAWTSQDPPTKAQAIDRLNSMYDSLSTQQKRRRDQAIGRARRAILNGPIYAQYIRSFQNHPLPNPPNARIDIEVQEGRAFV